MIVSLALVSSTAWMAAQSGVERVRVFDFGPGVDGQLASEDVCVELIASRALPSRDG